MGDQDTWGVGRTARKGADRKDWANGLSASGSSARRISTSLRTRGTASRRHSERKNRVGTSGRSIGAVLFLLGRMLEQIVARAAERALAIAYVETSLVLDSTSRMEHRRVVRPALPECNHHTLLKLIQLDLEMHPPQAAVIGLYMQAQPARPQAGQQGLFVPQTPEAGQLEVLLARLRKLLGEDRVGAPELLDSHRPDAFRLVPFVPHPGAVPHAASGIHTSALRLLRPPQAVRVEMESSRIVTLFLDGKKLPSIKLLGLGKRAEHGGLTRIGAAKSGTWRWEAGKICCRVAYDPASDCWYLIGIYD